MAELAKEIGVVKVERQCLERGSGATGGKELERERVQLQRLAGRRAALHVSCTTTTHEMMTRRVIVSWLYIRPRVCVSLSL